MEKNCQFCFLKFSERKKRVIFRLLLLSTASTLFLDGIQSSVFMAVWMIMVYWFDIHFDQVSKSIHIKPTTHRWPHSIDWNERANGMEKYLSLKWNSSSVSNMWTPPNPPIQQTHFIYIYFLSHSNIYIKTLTLNAWS